MAIRLDANHETQLAGFRADFEEIEEIVWRRCVLCTRCYCPLGIDIPEMIAITRDICRSQDVYFQWSELEQPAE